KPYPTTHCSSFHIFFKCKAILLARFCVVKPEYWLNSEYESQTAPKYSEVVAAVFRNYIARVGKESPVASDADIESTAKLDKPFFTWFPLISTTAVDVGREMSGFNRKPKDQICRGILDKNVVHVSGISFRSDTEKAEKEEIQSDPEAELAVFTHAVRRQMI